ncbi:hypothetical protein ACF0H5_007994 [Mactra antiquata]
MRLTFVYMHHIYVLGGKLAVGHVLLFITCVSFVMGSVSAGCIICGVLTVIYESSTFAFPYSTGSGIWTGIVTCLISVFGIRFTEHYSTENPSASRCNLIAFYVLTVMDISMSLLHTIFSCLGLASSINNSKTDSGKDIRYVCGLNIFFGCVIMLVAIATIVYMNIGLKLHLLAGHPVDPPAASATCCKGSCKC